MICQTSRLQAIDTREIYRVPQISKSKQPETFSTDLENKENTDTFFPHVIL